jgi:hypothetical protein
MRQYKFNNSIHAHRCRINSTTRQRGKHTVDSLSVLLLLTIENRIFVLRQHLLLRWHLLLPSLNSLRGSPLSQQCLIND